MFPTVRLGARPESEVGSGLGLWLLRHFLKAKRPFTMELRWRMGRAGC